ncbi:MAG: hypothetical protein NT069_10215 [Planctomycetota bacterium]|nr:hypothetical protein [Planctomycetota bacterium]
MTINNWEVLVTSNPDETSLVAEVWCNNKLFAEVRLEHSTHEASIDIAPLGSLEVVRLRLSDFESSIKAAVHALKSN